MKSLNSLKNILIVAGLAMSVVVVGCEQQGNKEKKEGKKTEKEDKSDSDKADKNQANG